MPSTCTRWPWRRGCRRTAPHTASVAPMTTSGGTSSTSPPPPAHPACPPPPADHHDTATAAGVPSRATRRRQRSDADRVPRPPDGEGEPGTGLDVDEQRRLVRAERRPRELVV